MEFVKQKASTGNKKFIEVPPGDNKLHAEFPIGFIPGPEINYKQENERVCLVALFASFLHAMNCQQDAALLFSMKNRIQEYTNVWTKFISYLSELSPYLQVEKYEYLPNSSVDIQPQCLPLVICV